MMHRDSEFRVTQYSIGKARESMAHMVSGCVCTATATGVILDEESAVQSESDNTTPSFFVIRGAGNLK